MWALADGAQGVEFPFIAWFEVECLSKRGESNKEGSSE